MQIDSGFHIHQFGATNSVWPELSHKKNDIGIGAQGSSAHDQSSEEFCIDIIQCSRSSTCVLPPPNFSVSWHDACAIIIAFEILHAIRKYYK